MNLIDFSLFFLANMVFQLLIKTLKLWFFANWTIHISNLNFNWLYLLERQYFVYSSLFKVLSSNLKNLCDSFIIFLFLIERLIYIYIYNFFFYTFVRYDNEDNWNLQGIGTTKRRKLPNWMQEIKKNLSKWLTP